MFRILEMLSPVKCESTTMEPFFTPQVTTLNSDNVSHYPRKITPICSTTLRIDLIGSESNADKFRRIIVKFSDVSERRYPFCFLALLCQQGVWQISML